MNAWVGAHVSQSSGESAAVVAAALMPYAWRELTDRMLARRVVGMLDRYVVLDFISDLPGVDAGPVEEIEPAEPGDARVDALVRGLYGQEWRSRSLFRLCTDLVSTLEAWHAALVPFEADRRRLEDS